MTRHYLVATVVAAVLSAIYESLSHGVISVFMVGLAAWPFVLGVLPTWIAGAARAPEPAPLACTLLACGALTLTFGSIVAGVMEIYGSTSAFTPVYWVVGAAIMAAAVAVFVTTPRETTAN